MTDSSGRYIDAIPIGRGGAGDVFRVHDTRLNRLVAIKRLRPEDSQTPLAGDAALVEARHLALLQHPNIVTIYDFIQDDSGILVVMEYVCGRTVQEAAEGSPFKFETFLEFAKQTLDGMVAAHSHGMIHHDIKPSNIMMSPLLDETFQIKILDFGLAELVGIPQHKNDKDDEGVVGTIYTMPPEQIERQKMDERSDLYSFGCVCYFALTGQYPFTGTTVSEIVDAHLRNRVKPLGEIRKDLPPLLCDWVMRMIAKSPAARHQSALEAEAELKEAFFPSHITTKILSDQELLDAVNQLKKGRSKLVLVATLLFSLFAAGMTWFLLWDRQKAETQSIEARGVVVGTPSAVSPLPAPSAAPVALPPINTRELMANIGQQATVAGAVANFRENKSGTIRYLDFQSDGQQKLSLVFFVRDGAGTFTKEKISGFVGQNIRVTGKVGEFEGAPQIVVKNFSQITRP